MTWIGTPAETQRGQRFYEPFNLTPAHTAVTSGAVTFNQGFATVGNTASDYILYNVGSDVIPPVSKPFSVCVRTRDLNPASGITVFTAFGSSPATPLLIGTNGPNLAVFSGPLFVDLGVPYTDEHHISVVFTGAAYRIFVDGVFINQTAGSLDLGVNPQIWVGGSNGAGLNCGGDILSIRVFNTVLTDQEIIDFYNRETYSYLTQAVGSWPMLAATHDPGNSRTLDVSGNANHATFSPTPPTKISGRHGYDFNGTNNYFTTPAAIYPGVNSFSIFVAFNPAALTGDHCLIGTGWGSGNFSFLRILSGTKNVQWTNLVSFVGSDNVGSQALTTKFGTLCGVIDAVASRSRLYRNGVLNNDVPHTNVDITPTLPYWIGERNGIPGILFNGDILSVFFIHKALTPIQIKNLHLGALSTYNQE